MRSKTSIFSITLILALSYFFSCTKAVEPSLVIPSTYRYNSPNLFSKTIYAIDKSKNLKVISDTLGSFNRANQEIADSINKIINQEFLGEMIKQISFISQSEIELTFAKLDTVMQKNKLVETTKTKTNYTLTGNDIALQAFPHLKLSINNSFLELNMCSQFVLQSQPLTDTSSYKFYSKEWCKSKDPEQIVRDLLLKNPSIKYDTASVEIVNYIFSKY
jgi:hypothetical protein